MAAPLAFHGYPRNRTSGSLILVDQKTFATRATGMGLGSFRLHK